MKYTLKKNVTDSGSNIIIHLLDDNGLDIAEMMIPVSIQSSEESLVQKAEDFATIMQTYLDGSPVVQPTKQDVEAHLDSMTVFDKETEVEK